MAFPRPTLRLGFFKLPSTAVFVPRTRTPVGTGNDQTFTVENTTAVAPRYAYGGGQFLDEIFTFHEVPLIGGQVTDFSANLRLNVGCDWQFSWQYDVTDPNEVAVAEAALDPSAFCAWYIQTQDADDGVASLRGFMGGTIFDDIDVDVTPLISTVFVPANHYARRGMSGPVSTARASELADGKGLLEVTGKCWASALEETPHLPIAKDVRQTGSPGMRPLDAYPVYTPMTSGTSSARRTAIRSWMAHIFRNNSDLKDSASHISDSPTQIGKWLLRPAFTEAALNEMANPSSGTQANFTYAPGPHSVLKTLQNIAARAGLVMHTTFPLIWFDVGVASTAKVEFRNTDFASSTLTRRKPTANYFVIAHSDPVTQSETLGEPEKVLRVIRENATSAELYGLLTRTLQSTAPQRGIPQEGEDVAISRDEMIELLSAQAEEAAIRAFANEDGDIETGWRAGSRYGIDWNLGDTVKVYVGGLESDELLVNSVAIRMNSVGDWSFRAGLGSTADLAPQIRHRIEAGETVSY